MFLTAVGCSSISIDTVHGSIPYKIVDHHSPAVDTNLTVGLLGNTNVLISDGQHAILIDGFFTRSGLLRAATIGKSPTVKVIKKALARGNVKSTIEAVVVSHSHFDHSMDAPLVAAVTGAQLIGSKDINFITRGLNSVNEISNNPGPPKITTISDCGGQWRNDTFEIHLYPSAHGTLVPRLLSKLLGGRVSKPVIPPASMFAYKEGVVYTIWIKHLPTGKTFLIQTSSGTGSFSKDLKADVVFLGVANVARLKSRDMNAYYKQFVENTQPRLVIPVHWEDFYRSQEGPIKPRINIFDGLNKTKDFLEQRIRESPDTHLYWLGPDERVILPTGEAHKMSTGDCIPNCVTAS